MAAIDVRPRGARRDRRVPKDVVPFLVIVPGMIAIARACARAPAASSCAQADGTLNYDLSIPMMLSHYFPHGAGWAHGAAGQLHVGDGRQRPAFNTVWTYDIYSLHHARTDHHYLNMGRVARCSDRTVRGCAYVANHFTHHGYAAAVVRFRECAAVCDFLLEFWKRLRHGALRGCCPEPCGRTTPRPDAPRGSIPGIKGGWLTLLHAYRANGADCWTAIWAFRCASW